MYNGVVRQVHNEALTIYNRFKLESVVHDVEFAWMPAKKM